MILILDSKSTIFELVSVLSLISEMDSASRGGSKTRLWPVNTTGCNGYSGGGGTLGWGQVTW